MSKSKMEIGLIKNAISTVYITWYRRMAKRVFCGRSRSCPPSSGKSGVNLDHVDQFLWLVFITSHNYVAHAYDLVQTIYQIWS